jgi:sugar phosphate isomerase/epimerase
MFPTSFSTCWNSQSHSDGAALVAEIIQLGFDTIEVSHGMKVSLLPGIAQAVRDRRVQVSSVHNFCPSPVEVMIDAPDAYEFSSHRSFDRKRALDLTLATLETAASLSARHVVLHLGTVPIHHYTPELFSLVSAGKIHSRSFVDLKLKAVEQRSKMAPLYLARAAEALAQIADRARVLGIVLGVESRSHYEQIPDEPEMLALMRQFKDDPHVGYWHDFGHVQRRHNLALCHHPTWLVAMRPFLVGCHVHDLEWPAKDHRVPLTTGGIDYPSLLPLLPQGVPLVWEISSRRRAKTIREAIPRWHHLLQHQAPLPTT